MYKNSQESSSHAAVTRSVGGASALVELRRGHVVESVHRGIVVESSSDGLIRFSLGDPTRFILPRSLIKPLQAISLVATGAASQFGLGQEELALAASSHLSHPDQITALNCWLKRISCSASDLGCGVHRPFDYNIIENYIKSGEVFCEIHNRNSGRHLALLTICKHMGYSIENYWNFDHPVQKTIRDTMRSFIDWEFTPQEAVLEVCGVPTEAIPAQVFVAGLAAMSGRSSTSATHSGAAKDILAAMASRPDLVTGPGKISTLICNVTSGRLIVKGGSEGGFATIVPEKKLALLVKIDDGAHRAAEVLLLEVLYFRGLLNYNEYNQIRKIFDGVIKNFRGEPVGHLRVQI